MTERIRVLAVDPGEKVGWARGDIDPANFARKPTKLRHGITALKDMALAIHRTAGDYDVVIYETWRLRPDVARKMVGSDFPSSQFIGMVRLATWLNPSVQLVGQGPDTKTTARKTAPRWLTTKLRAMPARHDDAHDGDALMHLWFYLWNTYAGGPVAT